MFNMKSRHLLNLSIQNALDCISEKFNLKDFPRGACARNSLEKCAGHCPKGCYCAHITTVYYISKFPLSHYPPSAPGSTLQMSSKGFSLISFVALHTAIAAFVVFFKICT